MLLVDWHYFVQAALKWHLTLVLIDSGHIEYLGLLQIKKRRFEHAFLKTPAYPAVSESGVRLPVLLHKR